MYNSTFFKKSILYKALTGAVVILFALASILVTIPASFAHAAGLDPLTAIGYAEDARQIDDRRTETNLSWRLITSSQ
jgi:hypothetical protein